MGNSEGWGPGKDINIIRGLEHLSSADGRSRRTRMLGQSLAAGSIFGCCLADAALGGGQGSRGGGAASAVSCRWRGSGRSGRLGTQRRAASGHVGTGCFV